MSDSRPLRVILDGLQYEVADLAIAPVFEERAVRELAKKTRTRIRRAVRRLSITWESPACQVRAGKRAEGREQDRGGAR